MRALHLSILAALMLPPFATLHAAEPSRPNILFIYTDDQSYDALSVVPKEQGEKGRFPWLKTPSLDRLAADGVRFRNAFVTNSLCSPSRAVNLTGLYNHELGNGIASNFRPFPMSNVTHATLMREAGYTTAYVGKWHMGNQRECPGFDFHATYLGHGQYGDCPFIVDGKDTPIRMEPVFMILSQGAATAAAIAVDRGVFGQEVTYEDLRKQLLKDDQRLDRLISNRLNHSISGVLSRTPHGCRIVG